MPKMIAGSRRLSIFVLKVVTRVLNSVLECWSAVGICLHCPLSVQWNVVTVTVRVFYLGVTK